MGGVDARGSQLLDGRYRLVEQLGAGGMAVVLRGYDEVLGRQVAVKVLAPTLAADDSFRRRIRIEAQAAARLCHPHITNVYDYGEADLPDGSTVPYVVMELVDGKPLAAHLAGGAALPWREAVAACTEIASALAAAHARGVVHRDITPANVILTPGGAKVVDFGISAVVGESDQAPDGSLLGTPAYVAPERLDAGTVSPATDVYALGVLLYRTLTGRLPWEAATTTQMLTAHRYADPAPMPAVAGLPEEVGELCRRCLAKRPEERPSSAAVARALAGVIGITALVPVSPAGPVSAEPGPVGEANLATANTTILPLSAAVAGLPRAARPVRPMFPGRWATAGRRPPRARARPTGTTGAVLPGIRRRAEATLVAAGLLAITGVIWVGASRSPEEGSAAGGQDSALGPGSRPAECRVAYELTSDTGRSFAASVTVTNTAREPVEQWRLRFAFPGEQRVSRISTGDWDQSGRVVVVRPDSGAATLAPGASTVLNLTGSYRGANSGPMAFDLAGTACQSVVSAPGGGIEAGGNGTGGGPAGTGTVPGGGAAGNGTPAGGSGNSGPGGGDNSGPGGGQENPRPEKTKKPKKGNGGGGGAPIPLPSLPVPIPSLPLPTPSVPVRSLLP
ncbi:MAG TPA: serine/threonine-protein kinase [Pilimelia sp.]|nr:serine/threonine-protein kinase [Pilimelia sp.]